VNLFNIDIEKLRGHYINIFGLDNQDKKALNEGAEDEI
jgi:hypothetical protein